ncbi:hypothetical protein ACGC1H_003998 [Rhizoctonia solani]
MSGRTGPPGAQARRRQRRWDGLQSWKMKEVLTVLPSLIHLSLLLFAVGLCVFLWEVHYGVAIPVVIVTALAAGTYFACTILPFIDSYCPYGTVLSRLYKQFSSQYHQSVRDNIAQDETTGRALHWMVVNCETPRSVDVALQSLAAANRGLPPGMLERCDVWSLIRQRLEFIDPTGEQANPARLLYKRALECHFQMRTLSDISSHEKDGTKRLVPLALGVQGCLNSIIHKLLGQLRPLDRNRSLLERCMLIGPQLLAFEFDIPLIDLSTSWDFRLRKYEKEIHFKRTKALAQSITHLLEQHLGHKIEIEPALQCVLSSSLAVLLCRQSATNPSVAGEFIQQLILAHQSPTLDSNSRLRINQKKSQRDNNLSDKKTLVFLLGALSISNSHCFIQESPCYTNQAPHNDKDLGWKSERALELTWKYPINFVHSNSSSFGLYQTLIHSGLHLLARAEAYNLSPESCMFICNLMEYRPNNYSGSSKDNYCLVHHIHEFSAALRKHPNMDYLTPQCLAFLDMLPSIVHGYECLMPTPEIYVLAIRRLCSHGSSTGDNLIQLILCFPFPKASSRLVELLSISGIFTLLADSLKSNGWSQAFAIAQLWLLFDMLLQSPDCPSNTLNTLETMLLQYTGLENSLDKLEEVVQDLETRLPDLITPHILLDKQDERDGLDELDSIRAQIQRLTLALDKQKYLSRVLECMCQRRCTPLPKEAHDSLQELPQSLRGIHSFVDLEIEAMNPSHGNNVGHSFYQLALQSYQLISIFKKVSHHSPESTNNTTTSPEV